MAKCMLTTVDNPYNPFTQWDAWFRFDRAIDEIMKYNFLGLYRKVTEPKASASSA